MKYTNNFGFTVIAEGKIAAAREEVVKRLKAEEDFTKILKAVAHETGIDGTGFWDHVTSNIVEEDRDTVTKQILLNIERYCGDSERLKALEITQYIENDLKPAVMSVLSLGSTESDESACWMYIRNMLTDEALKIIDDLPDDLHINALKALMPMALFVEYTNLRKLDESLVGENIADGDNN